VRATWWVPLVQGLAALAIGLMLWTQPGPTLVGLTMFLGAYWLISGVSDVIGAVSRRQSDQHWGLALLSGLVASLAGLLLLGQPVIGALATSIALVSVVAVAAIASGILSIVWAVRVRHEIEGEAWIIVFGVLSVVLGLLLLGSPLVSAAVLIQFAAMLAIVGGITLVITAFRLRRVAW
jgi:uncharacterized membrane protein HdeD (DUF308 family)